MEEDTQHFQCIMLYYFKQSGNTTETLKKKMCTVYGEGGVTDQTCQKWFAKFLLSYALEDVSSTPGLYPLEANSRR